MTNSIRDSIHTLDSALAADSVVAEKAQVFAPTQSEVVLVKATESDAVDAQALTFIVDLNVQHDDDNVSLKAPDTASDLAKAVEPGEVECAGVTETLSEAANLPLALGVVSDHTEPCAAPPACEHADSVDNTPVEVACPPGLQAAQTNALPGAPPSSQSTSTSSPPQSVDKGEEADKVEVTLPEPLDDVFSMDLSIFSHDFSHLYSLDDVPPLDTFIPESLLPRDLFVHENRPRRIANGPRQRDTPMRYVRIYPTPGPVDRPSQNPVAHLYLDPNKNSLGKGNHSTVVRAPMVLRLDPDSRARSRVSVAVKLADNECGAHAMLRQEAKLYNSFPRHLMEDTVPSLCVRWNAVPAEASVPEVQEAVPAAKAAKCEEGGEGRESELVQAGVACAHKADEAQTTSQERSEPAMSSPPAVVQGERESGPVQHEDSISTANNDPPQPAESEKVQVLPAVVPKFYGYYAPLNPDGTPFSCEHEGCDVDSMCYVDWPTHVLLVEECGEPVHPYSVDTEDRRKCLDLFRRLHAAGFTQGSAYRRNMLIQPGPLSVPRDERTVDLPSFRLIDFGRGEARSMLDADVLDCFEGWAASELEQARRELRIS